VTVDDSFPPLDFPTILEQLRIAEAGRERAASEADYYRKAYEQAREASLVRKRCVDCLVDALKADDGVTRCWRCGRTDVASYLDLVEFCRRSWSAHNENG